MGLAANVGDVEDAYAAAVGGDALEALLEALEAGGVVPVLDRRAVGEVVAARVDFEAVVLEVVLELQKRKRGMVDQHK